MHEMVMQKNYAKAYKLVILLAVVLAVLSAVAVPLSLSQQIREAAAVEQSYGEDRHDGEHDGQQGGHDSEDAWKSQITPLTPGHFVFFGVLGLLWVLLAAWYWLLTAAWLYRSAVNAGMNKSLWMILGLAVGVPEKPYCPATALLAGRQRDDADLLAHGLLISRRPHAVLRDRRHGADENGSPLRLGGYPAGGGHRLFTALSVRPFSQRYLGRGHPGRDYRGGSVPHWDAVRQETADTAGAVSGLLAFTEGTPCAMMWGEVMAYENTAGLSVRGAGRRDRLGEPLFAGHCRRVYGAEKRVKSGCPGTLRPSEQRSG